VWVAWKLSVAHPQGGGYFFRVYNVNPCHAQLRILFRDYLKKEIRDLRLVYLEFIIRHFDISMDSSVE
jgi:hypothetical protein